jgi:hypothetical protein
MLSRVWLINVVLGLFLVFLGFKAHGVWVQGENGFHIPDMARKPAREAPKPPGTLHKKKIPPESAYDVLMTLNLFAAERAEILPEAAKPDEKSKKLTSIDKKNIQEYFSSLTLYGLVITNDSAEALVSHPVAKPVPKARKTIIPKNRRRNIKRLTVKQTQWVKAGDTLGDFKVVSIKPDRVVLKAGDQSYDLLLYDKNNLKKRAAPKPKTGPNVVGLSVKSKTGSKVPKVPTKSPVVKAKGQSTIPFPTQKGTSGTPVTKTRKSQK